MMLIGNISNIRIMQRESKLKMLKKELDEIKDEHFSLSNEG
jgi:hypothetical protein